MYEYPIKVIKGWEEGFRDGYIHGHGLEIAIIEIKNTMGRTKKSREVMCDIKKL